MSGRSYLTNMTYMTNMTYLTDPPIQSLRIQIFLLSSAGLQVALLLKRL